MQQGDYASSNRASRWSHPPRRGRPAEDPQYQQDLMKLFYEWVMLMRLPPMALLISMWTLFVQTPELQEAYLRSSIITLTYRNSQFMMAQTTESMQYLRELLLQNAIRSFEIVYSRLLTYAGFIEEPPHLNNPHMIPHTTYELNLDINIFNLPVWQRQYYAEYMRRSSLAATAPPPRPPSPVLPPQPEPLYYIPPLYPMANPTLSETGALTPEGPIDLSTRRSNGRPLFQESYDELWQLHYYTEYMRRSSLAATAPPPRPPSPVLPPQPELYYLPPLYPMSNPRLSETDASMPEGPLDLSTRPSTRRAF